MYRIIVTDLKTKDIETVAHLGSLDTHRAQDLLEPEKGCIKRVYECADANSPSRSLIGEVTA